MNTTKYLENIQWFDVEDVIYFRIFDIFKSAKHEWKILQNPFSQVKWIPCSMSNTEIYVYYIFYGFEHVSLKF